MASKTLPSRDHRPSRPSGPDGAAKHSPVVTRQIRNEGRKVSRQNHVIRLLYADDHLKGTANLLRNTTKITNYQSEKSFAFCQPC